MQVHSTAAQPAPRSKPSIAGVVKHALHPAARAIDERAAYPREILLELGSAGAFASLADGIGGTAEQADLQPAIDATAVVASACAATAFCCWCQSALVWYLRNTANPTLRLLLLPDVASGAVLGGTGLSNPMKHASGLEQLRLRETDRSGSVRFVSGAIPWVSNVEAGSPFGIVFATADGPPQIALADSSLDGVTLTPNDNFEVMGGTATVTAKFEHVPIDSLRVLAEDASAFIQRVRPGFVLLQAGIGLGLIDAAADAIDASRRAQSAGLPGGLLATSEQLRKQRRALAQRVSTQAAAAADGDVELEDLFALRLDLAQAAMRAATAAQLACGAGGLMRGRRSARLVREAAFYGVLTPSVRHLSYALAQLQQQKS